VELLSRGDKFKILGPYISSINGRNTGKKLKPINEIRSQQYPAMNDKTNAVKKLLIPLGR